MKRIFAIIFAAVCLAACTERNIPGNNEPQLPVTFTNTSGDWQLDSWKGNSMESAGVFIRLRNREFVLVQNVNSMYPTSYTGKYNLIEEDGTGTIIRGIYDFTSEYWQHNYIITSLTAQTMEWVAEDDPQDIHIYIRTTLFPTDRQ